MKRRDRSKYEGDTNFYINNLDQETANKNHWTEKRSDGKKEKRQERRKEE